MVEDSEVPKGLYDFSIVPKDGRMPCVLLCQLYFQEVLLLTKFYEQGFSEA